MTNQSITNLNQALCTASKAVQNLYNTPMFIRITKEQADERQAILNAVAQELRQKFSNYTYLVSHNTIRVTYPLPGCNHNENAHNPKWLKRKTICYIKLEEDNLIIGHSTNIIGDHTQGTINLSNPDYITDIKNNITRLIEPIPIPQKRY